MCIIFWAIHKHPKFPLILIANRDEHFARPTSLAHFDEKNPFILAGRDLQKGGSWLGITKSGRFAAITNYRVPFSDVIPSATSRGQIAMDFLEGSDTPIEFVRKLAVVGSNYTGFNILVAVGCNFAYYSNVNQQGPVELKYGEVYGLSNAFLDTPWPKVCRGKEMLSDYISQLCSNGQTEPPDTHTSGNEKELDFEHLLEIMHDSTKPPASSLPNTGVGEPWETLLSSIFVSTPFSYGTRCSTVFVIDSQGHVTFIERSFCEDGTTSDAKFEFSVPDIV